MKFQHTTLNFKYLAHSLTQNTTTELLLIFSLSLYNKLISQTNRMGMESKLWNIVRVALFMLKKGILKSKIMVVKRGKAVAGSLMLHHHYVALTCRSDDSHLSFVSPRDYEFSCSNSPAFPFHANKRKHHRHLTRVPRSSYQYNDVSTVKAVQKVLIEMLNRENVEAANSPVMTLPGFGKSPTGRQLKITDSPFALNDDDDVDGDAQVDKAAEEFINKFYRDLDLQRTMAALDSPYHYFWDR